MTAEARARRLMIAGAAVSVVGLALAGTVAPALGVVSLVGWALLGLGAHRFGRS